MEYSTIQREIEIDAAPEIVYEVVSAPEHLREWWPDEAELDPVPGGTGTIAFTDDSGPRGVVQAVTVVEAEPPHRFSFRWVYDEDDPQWSTKSLLVTFDLVPKGDGTLLRFSEEGFREKGWEAALLEQEYNDHVSGWAHFLPRLVSYAARVAAERGPGR